MGFRLGTALGKIASGVVRQATGGLVRPSFQRPTIAPRGFQQPDSSRTQVRITPFGYQRNTTDYFTQPGQNKNLPAGGVSAAAAMPRGCHLNKSTYVTRGGGTSRWPTGLQLHPKGTECVTRRKMNPGNGRAALHAVRRLVAFYRLSNRVAKQLRKAASRAHIRGARHGRARLPAGRNVEVVNVE